MNDYKRVQIIKHALQMYVRREGASKQDVHSEKIVLKDYKEKAAVLKEKYHIKEGDSNGASEKISK